MEGAKVLTYNLYIASANTEKNQSSGMKYKLQPFFLREGKKITFLFLLVEKPQKEKHLSKKK